MKGLKKAGTVATDIHCDYSTPPAELGRLIKRPATLQGLNLIEIFRSVPNSIYGASKLQ